jgi:hypothetical protein
VSLAVSKPLQTVLNNEVPPAASTATIDRLFGVIMIILQNTLTQIILQNTLTQRSSHFAWRTGRALWPASQVRGFWSRQSAQCTRMSALGHKRTLRGIRLMSALPPKADIAASDENVRYVPQADSCIAAKRIYSITSSAVARVSCV